MIPYTLSLLQTLTLSRWRINMDYHEACEAIVSRQEARLELEAHGAPFHEFALERGDRDEYYGYEILNFLGY